MHCPTVGHTRAAEVGYGAEVRPACGLAARVVTALTPSLYDSASWGCLAQALDLGPVCC